MLRRSIFLGAWLALVSQALSLAQDTPVSPPRPPAEIHFGSLKADAILKVSLGTGSTAIDDAVWLVQHAVGTVVRLDPTDNSTAEPVAAGKTPCATIAVAFDSLWVPLCDGAGLARIDVKSGALSATLPLGVADPTGSIAVAVGSLWILTDPKGVLSRIDPATNAPVAEIYLSSRPSSVAADNDALWITSEEGDLLTRVDPHTNNTIETVKVGPKPGRVVVGEGAVWTLNRGDGSVSRVDPKTNKLVATIAVDPAVASGAIAVGEGGVWISAVGVPITRIDPRTNRVVQRFIGDGGGAILVGHGSLWVAAGPTTTWRLDPGLVAAMRPD